MKDILFCLVFCLLSLGADAVPGKGKDIPASLTPVISDNYRSYFSWNGEGEIPEDQYEKMKQLLEKVHQEKKLLKNSQKYKLTTIFYYFCFSRTAYNKILFEKSE